MFQLTLWCGDAADRHPARRAVVDGTDTESAVTSRLRRSRRRVGVRDADAAGASSGVRRTGGRRGGARYAEKK